MKQPSSDEYEQKLSRNCYYVLLGVAAFLVLGYLILSFLHITLFDLRLPPCVLYTVTGLYCPGCGGTRSVYFLLHGDFLRSLIYHPLVPFTAAYSACYIISHTLSIITRGKLRAMRFHYAVLFAALGIVVVNWILKDALILLFDIHLMG